MPSGALFSPECPQDPGLNPAGESPGPGEDRGDGRLERGQVVDRDTPDRVEVDAEVLVNEGVAETDDAPPGYLRVFGDEPR